ncbi:MAG: diaminobutyrate--2-oxoglutarate transaminase family protein [Solirubrobacteraceae bacterium]|nr:diaminobutyrate--2-oxoglutarate transaminase family protein [Solirubrobacteraceae bacterium]
MLDTSTSPSEPMTGDPLLARQRRRESSARTYPRSLPIALVSGRGAMVTDSAGREYLDCLSGAGALALGHHHPVVVAALDRTLRDQVPLTTLDLTTPVRDAFVESLFEVLPPHLRDGRIQFCGPSGADAVEAAVKLVRTATGRDGMVAFAGGYHGMTQGTLALTGDLGAKQELGSLAADVHHVPFPTSLRCPYGVGGDQGAQLCARTLRSLLEDDHSGVVTPAGVIVEPVQGEGGVHPMPAAFATELREMTRRAGVPLIVDEVQTGVGRTGTLWASEALGLEPDVLVLSKAIGGGLPLAVIVYRRELDTWRPGAHAGTFRGNQLAMAAGEATLRHVVTEDLPARAEEMGQRLRAALRAESATDETVGDVRGRGLMVGVEIVDPAQTNGDGVPVPNGARAAAIQRGLLEAGVIAERGGRGNAVVRFLPPLILGEDQADRIATAFGRALRNSPRTA